MQKFFVVRTYNLLKPEIRTPEKLDIVFRTFVVICLLYNTLFLDFIGFNFIMAQTAIPNTTENTYLDGI